ncbi:MAG: hypothetical protein MJ169_00720 [Treponema sp.]|nr:hypothetical protein [Treponema sp.]
MTRIHFKKALLSAAFAIITAFNAQAVYYSLDELNFLIDLPEGYQISDAAQDGSSFFFETKLMPVKVALKFYNAPEYNSSAQALQNVLDQLQCKVPLTTYEWYGRDTSLSTFSFTAANTVFTGWALAVNIPDKNKYLVLMAYSDQMISEDCEQFTLSIMDNIYLCAQDFRRFGPVSHYAYYADMNNPEEITLNIADTQIKTSIDKLAKEAEQFVLEREWAVLTLYANHPDWKTAWQRYYRQLFKQSYVLLDKVSQDIYISLFKKAREANKMNPQLEIAKYILSWTQDFEYQRDHKTTDFTPLTAAITGTGSDCDSRSMLICCLCEHLGIKTELFISREYSHAVCGLAVDYPGAAIEVDGVNYVLGETTAKVDLGRIAQTQSDTSKWIEVDLP